MSHSDSSFELTIDGVTRGCSRVLENRRRNPVAGRRQAEADCFVVPPERNQVEALPGPGCLEHGDAVHCRCPGARLVKTDGAALLPRFRSSQSREGLFPLNT